MIAPKKVISFMAHKQDRNQQHTLATNQAANIVFAEVLDSVLSFLEHAGHKVGLAANIAITERLWNFEMPADSRRVLKARLMRNQPLERLQLDITVVANVFQVIYEELCGEVGPVITDRACQFAMDQIL